MKARVITMANYSLFVALNLVHTDNFVGILTCVQYEYIVNSQTHLNDLKKYSMKIMSEAEVLNPRIYTCIPKLTFSSLLSIQYVYHCHPFSTLINIIH